MTTFGIHLTAFDAPELRGDRLLPGLTELADALEGTPGFSTLWLADHMQDLRPGSDRSPMPEAYLTLAALAARTSRLELGVLATSVLYRSPALLAKMATTLDALSGGRAILGIGAGHPRTEAEHRSYGYEFPSVPQRMARLDEALVTIRRMVGGTADPDAPPNWPRPARVGGIPVLVAGSGEQRLLRIAARHADLINLSFPSGDFIDRIPHKLAVLADHCRTVGRDPATIGVTYKAVLCVADSAASARSAWDGWRHARGVPDGLDSRHGVFVGEPGEIAEQLQPWLTSGIGHMVFELPDPHDRKTLIRASELLSGLT
ncbi:MAG: LLM class flavin-dependent oxidoreductase [Jatrophihabitans sp.]|uniref:LLM class flavin-dependent oxidoreductase n=1 Tax=Jatrophihabitans sp. TaxID=1932789 RepID=UPI00390F9EAD